MRNRVHNVFVRFTKNRIVADILTGIVYKLLCICYFVVRTIPHKKSNITVADANKKLNETSVKPKMNAKGKKNSICKDLSIIVPAFNAGTTIVECIESVLCQKTRYDYELIVINDGSTDDTKEKVEKYQDSHVLLVNQENKGFSGARNRGMDVARGKYIMFLDSDDFLVDDCIEKMLYQAESQKADIVQGSCYSFYDGSDIKNYSILKDKVIIDDTEEMIYNPGFPWAKVYRRELFDNLRFPLDVWFEDTIVCMLLFRMCRKVVVMSEVVYAYRINPQGITKKARHNKKCIDHYWVMEFCLDKARELGLQNDVIQYNMVRKHMSTLLYRRISLMDSEIIESAFILAAEMLDSIRPKGYICSGNLIERDIEKAFITRNYKLWKVASFVV